MTNAEQLGTMWWSAMLAGDFERSWTVSDRVRRLGIADPYRVWQGEDVAGRRVILRCLHGFGDSVQFLRYVPLLQAKAASLCVEVAPRFVDLAHCFAGVTEVITWGQDAPVTAPQWDVQVEVMELAYLFRTQLADLPLAVDYLRVRPAPRCSAGAFRVGLMWTAGEWNPSRGIPFALLQPLLEVARCQFWNLTTSSVPERFANRVLEDANCRESLMGLAERIASLDLVITADTLGAHIAGAIGIPAFVMLQSDADWRWMRVREDCPWYPSLRLFRCPEDEGWPVVVTCVAEALRACVEHAENVRACRE